MAGETVRVHIVIPKSSVEEIDQLVGRRKRSAFIVEAVAAKVERELLGRALEQSTESLTDDSYPEWETPEKISAWVRELRSPKNDDAESRRD